MTEPPVLGIVAGGLTAELAGTGLGQVRADGWEALDGVYVAVRDAAWRTVPATVVSFRTEPNGDGSLTSMAVRHVDGGVDFSWTGWIQAEPDRIRFSMEGLAGSSFEANRIGFCLLHPQSLRGRPVHVAGPDGEVDAVFPEAVAPHQPFLAVTRMRYEVADGVTVELDLEGDLFEVEDHRNWSDPGWKTYCTPLSNPRPVRHHPGQPVRQAVEIRLQRSPSARPLGPHDGPVRINIGPEVIGTVPALGLGAALLNGLPDEVGHAVADMHPAHLHVELEQDLPWRRHLAAAAAEATSLDVPLDVALSADRIGLPELAKATAHAGARIGRVSVFGRAKHTTEEGTLSVVRQVFAAADVAAAFGGGSRAHLAELNRAVVDATDWDFATYGLTPQVHHSDERAVLATAAAIPDGLAQVRRIVGPMPIIVGPLTLRPRFRADAEAPDPIPAADADGPDIDERLHEDLGALYLAAAIPALLGAEAVTAYRTVGPRGVVTATGDVTPAARLIKLITAFAGRPAHGLTCSDPLVATLAIETRGEASVSGYDLLVANLAPASRNVRLNAGRILGAQLLDGKHLEPSGFRAGELELPGRSVVTIQVERPS
jgi:D-apionolactonase